MTDEERTRIGEAWLDMGLGEHASIASFARFVLHLLSVGAPPDLVHDAIRAMDDEVEHARLCFGVARQFSGRAASPGPLDLSGVFSTGNDASSILRAAILEGCFEETISARCAELALRRAQDPTVETVLARIVRDESMHAELSWRFVGWMLENRPDLIATAEQCFADALASKTADDPEEDDDCAILETHGHLLPRSRREVRDATVRTEIVEQIVALLGRRPVADNGSYPM